MLARNLFALALLSQLVACEPMTVISWHVCIAQAPAGTREPDLADELRVCR